MSVLGMKNVRKHHFGPVNSSTPGVGWTRGPYLKKAIAYEVICRVYLHI